VPFWQGGRPKAAADRHHEHVRSTSWAGLTPKHRESDTVVRPGSITKQGSALVRWAAVEAAQGARNAGWLDETRTRIAEGRPARTDGGRTMQPILTSRDTIARQKTVCSSSLIGERVGCARLCGGFVEFRELVGGVGVSPRRSGGTA
jgi:hypothetical protein